MHKALEHFYYRTSLAVQWLRLRASTAEGAGSIPSQGPKIPHAKGQSQKKKKIHYCYNCILDPRASLREI